MQNISSLHLVVVILEEKGKTKMCARNIHRWSIKKDKEEDHSSDKEGQGGRSQGTKIIVLSATLHMYACKMIGKIIQLRVPTAGRYGCPRDEFKKYFFLHGRLEAATFVVFIVGLKNVIYFLECLLNT